MSTGTDLTPALEQGRIALREGASLADVAKQVYLATHEGAVVPVAATVAVPKAPESIDLTKEQQEALKRLPDVFNSVKPATRTALSDAQVAAVRDEQETLRLLLAALVKRDEDIKEIVRNHMDVTAEKDGRADEKTPRDAAGHYILASKGNPERVKIPGTPDDYSREFHGGTITISGGDLDDLHAKGEVTRADYLALTVEKRVFDEHKATKAIKDDPSRMDILRRITKRGADGTALFVRKTR